MESPWLAIAKRLQALAVTGQQFTRDQYELERYSEIESLSNQMLALLGNAPIAVVETLFASGETGYVTPKVEVRGAILRGDRILLVQEKEDGLWAMPGGYADVGLSPAENVEKEVWEEAGMKVKACHLYALRHKARGDYPPDPRDFYKLHFICQCQDTEVPSPGLETHAAEFFPLHSLPPLSLGKVLPEDVQAAFDFVERGELRTYFD
ncbi:NUDIX hydrolase [Ketobacter alkanivorans]|uniref:DNA mismatch repair protein MutT n=1 Tax=Ketobacter alkanivorans TaxID=1917421 RepID=A0A2K9LJJ0_9GAMM|nr:NUDIX hydrolase [Ketobacter alkanivorans]AUM12423.1 DNA mismatch repair protein MutT [Ketobacter alkanivorans]MCP5019276.1 NUDIX hydrolase [Ketobacter sp.]